MQIIYNFIWLDFMFLNFALWARQKTYCLLSKSSQLIPLSRSPLELLFFIRSFSLVLHSSNHATNNSGRKQLYTRSSHNKKSHRRGRKIRWLYVIHTHSEKKKKGRKKKSARKYIKRPWCAFANNTNTSIHEGKGLAYALIHILTYNTKA